MVKVNVNFRVLKMSMFIVCPQRRDDKTPQKVVHMFCERLLPNSKQFVSVKFALLYMKIVNIIT